MLDKIKRFFKSLNQPEIKENDFDLKYPLEKKAVPEKRDEFLKIFLEKGEKNLEQMRKIPNRAKALHYFEEISGFSQRIKEIQDFKKSGGKVIGTFCNFVPEELIYAANCVPIRLCAGFYETIEQAEEMLPQDICPLIKSCFGCKMVGLPYFELCDLAIMPTVCDGKKKLAEILSDWLPVWLLELPNIKDGPYSKEIWLAEIKRLKKRLERLTGNKITYSKLKQAIELLHQRQIVFRRFYKIRQTEKPVISGRDTLLVTQTSFFDDLKRWTKNTEKLCQELEENLKNDLTICSGRAPRLVLTGASIIWPNYKLLNIIEELGGIIVGDTLCSGTQRLYNPVEVDEWVMEDMLRAVAEKYLLPSVCPCFTHSEDRIDNLLQMCQDFKADGVIYHQLRLCQVFDLEFQKIKQVLSKNKIPILRIQTDYSQEDVEQIKTRVEAFLEMLKTKPHYS